MGFSNGISKPFALDPPRWEPESKSECETHDYGYCDGCGKRVDEYGMTNCVLFDSGRQISLLCRECEADCNA